MAIRFNILRYIHHDAKFLVKDKIPLGQLIPILAQAGKGKSMFGEALAISMVFGKPFLGLETIQGDVLIIDQDTPTAILENRLLCFGQAFKPDKQKHNLFLSSMEGHSLSDGTLINEIEQYPSAKLVLIDSLHSVSDNLNTNSTQDMAKLTKLKNACLNEKRTIILVHHISEKNDIGLSELMRGETGKLAMGSSVINQQADSYFILSGEGKAGMGELNKLYIRPVTKRVPFDNSPMVLKLCGDKDTAEWFELDGTYRYELKEIEQDILALFTDNPIERKVETVYRDMGAKHGINAVRQSLKDLTAQGDIQFRKEGANIFKYRLS